MNLVHVEALCALEDPYQVGEHADQLFDAAMREVTAYHQQHSPGYAEWLCQQQFDPSTLCSQAWGQLPPIFANYLKKHLLLSESGLDALELTSSGTTGQKSRMRYDTRSLGAAQGMVDRIYRRYGWDTPQVPCNYLMLGYEPVGHSALGTAFTDNFLCKYAPVKQAFYALRHNGRQTEFDPFGVIEALQRFARDEAPLRILGFPAFMWFVLERMREMKVPPLAFAADSLAMFGGGWKTHADQQIPKAQLYARMNEQLGIPTSRCRDGYGSVEHCVPYVECENHRHHVPTYSRAFTRHTGTFALQGYGQPGLIQFVSPYITSSPAHSIVMSDLAVLHRGDECGCGIATDWFEILGRAGTGKSRSCALAASELIREN
ncbi:acyl-protein synthase [Pseudomonas entomophila]|uniref:Acyl-protein synthase n=2 Tax=Pseudomonas entomophila TaxID=312306 RepID=A0ABY9QNJ2_9PSED|nr:acyl-protein synthase [Pseudomonas entomophila]WMW05602.1 acyl-protein synthase [Pseudomonas entomophila]CAK13562.1 putative Long-chain-fatty-acid--luciferin-component ligase, acyl-protein synthase LuxE [Pseudomonas entomophila L48]